MAMDEAEAVRMRDAARASDRVAGLCPVPIGMAVDRAMARLLRDGDLGEIRLVRVAAMSDAYLNPDTPMNWRKDHRLSGRNMGMLGMVIEVVHRWFGWTADVQAAMQTFVPERTDTAGRRVMVRIPDQALAHTTLRAGFPVEYTVSTCTRHGRNAFEVYGTWATLRYDFSDETFMIARDGGPFEPVAIRREEVYDVERWDVERRFMAATRGEGEYRPDFEDGWRYMQVIQGMYDAAAEGRRVRLGE
jgi:predicted dehydrogenase